MSPLRNSAFRRLLGSYFVNEIGDNVALVALSVLVYDGTGEIWAVVGLFVLSRFVPALAAPFLVTAAERLPISRSLPLLYLAEAALFAVLSFIAAGDLLLGVVLVVTAIDAVVALTARSLTRGAVASALLPTGQIHDGNAAMNVALGLASAAGLALGGVLASASTVSTALAINAGSFLVVAVLTRAIDADRESSDESSVFNRLREGLRFVRDEPSIRTVLTLECGAIVLFTMVIPTEVVWVRESLNGDSATLGAVMAIWSAGILLGGLAFGRAKSHPPLSSALVATVMIGLAHLGMGLTHTAAFAFGMAFIGGVGNGIQFVAVMTFVQQQTPGVMQTRLSALVESLAAAMLGVGFVVGGVVATIFSAASSFSSSGLLLLVAAGALALRPPRVLRKPSLVAAH